jgi:glycosyltransferase involved in cell wall biosynthesis
LPEPGERGKILNNKVMWMVGGSTAFNTAIQMSIDDGCDYILHLDDDDWFHEKKIQVLNYACSQFSNPDYLFHYSTYKHRDRFPPDNIQKFELDNFHPRPAGLIHSTMCCHKSIMENFRYNNKIHQCGDIQLIQHAQHLKKTKNISILFIPLVLGYHPIEGESR